MPSIILLTPSPPAVDHPHPSHRVAVDHHHSRHSCSCSSSSVRRGEEGADVVSSTIVSQIERENRGPPQQEFLVSTFHFCSVLQSIYVHLIEVGVCVA
ncbi:hypothetical protein RHGRI_014374 [Rhododendron griersonianum]|uniref:Uncharacterized protein n=1 Tax=Rhododendron griersonianum TaxID=479676 RepID=A0AAV6K9F2_9ERIC|nr:hypothetical protein RHGRI_014374 [Rhododendron griersonianum]